MRYTELSVRQLNTIKGKPWQARAKYKDVSGKWRETSKVLKEAKGKKEAMRLGKEWMDALNAQYDTMPTADGLKTVAEVYIEYITNQLNAGELEKSTFLYYKYTFEKYVKPYLGDYIFSSIDKVVINQWLTELYNYGLSQTTIRIVFKRFKTVYNYYYDNGELLANPFKGVKTPKASEPKITHLTDKQMEEVLSAVYLNYEPEHPMYVGILLAFYAGLRRGEICGLRWNDIDFVNHTISVRSAIGFALTKDSAYTKNPKTKSSNRTFPMIPKLEQALLQRAERIKPKKNWFVVGEKEEFMLPNKYTKLFRKFVDKNNLVDAYGKPLAPHGLRHNFATVGIRSGMDIASLALMMGHSSRAMTLDIYGDANADALSVASVKLKEQFNDSTGYYWADDEPDESDVI